MVAILVIATIVLFIVADLVVQWLRMRRAKAASAVQPSAPTVVDLLVPNLQPERFILPGGVFSTEDTRGQTFCSRVRSRWG